MDGRMGAGGAGRALLGLGIAGLVLLAGPGPDPARADEVAGDEVVVPTEGTGQEPPPAATGEEPSPYDRHGPFLGLGASIFFPQFDGAASALSTAGGFTVRAGYRFLDYLAVEALYEWSQYSQSELGGNVQLTSHVATMDAKLIYPLRRFQPFVGGGVGMMNMNKFVGGVWQLADLNIGTELVWRVTGGFDLFLSEGWSAFAEASWVRPTSKLDQYQYVTTAIGLRYTF